MIHYKEAKKKNQATHFASIGFVKSFWKSRNIHEARETVQHREKS